MKFCEAMKLLKEGEKVTRLPWKDGVYFKMVGEEVKSFQPQLINYLYDESIMVSDEWIVEVSESSMFFCDIIPYLEKGATAKRLDWADSYIYLDNIEKKLVLHSMQPFPFVPDFGSFVADDWIELKQEL